MISDVRNRKWIIKFGYGKSVLKVWFEIVLRENFGYLRPLKYTGGIEVIVKRNQPGTMRLKNLHYTCQLAESGFILCGSDFHKARLRFEPFSMLSVQNQLS